MIEQAIKARLPLIRVRTTDSVKDLSRIVHALTGDHVHEYKIGAVKPNSVYYSLGVNNPEAMREKMRGANSSLLFINTEDEIGFDAGVLPVPTKLLMELAGELGWETGLHDGDDANMQHALKGLSLSTAEEVMLLTQAMYGALTPLYVRKVRAQLSPPSTGLMAIDTSIDWYVSPPDLHDWLKLVRPYFLKPESNDRLAPKGIIFHGLPGTGKTTAAKFIAREWDIPIYRLDLSTTLSKYIGESEQRMARTLAAVDREAPCVLLIDEVEKVFSTEDHGAVTRILSQLLWWLSEHKTRVFVVMTTNNLNKIPAELYRPGRLDKVFKLSPIEHVGHGVDFAEKVLIDVIPHSTQSMRNDVKYMASKWRMPISFAEATECVLDVIRTHRW